MNLPLSLTRVLLIMLLIVLLGVGAFYTHYLIKANKINSSEAARTLRAQDADGVKQAQFIDKDEKPFSFDDYIGSVLVVNAWATWFPLSSTELTDLNNLANAYNGKIHVMAINRKESPTLVKSYISSLGLSENLIIVIDPTDFFYQSIDGFSMTETVFYDAAGNITFHKRGSMKYEEMVLQTEKALETTKR